MTKDLISMKKCNLMKNLFLMEKRFPHRNNDLNFPYQERKCFQYIFDEKNVETDDKITSVTRKKMLKWNYFNRWQKRLIFATKISNGWQKRHFRDEKVFFSQKNDLFSRTKRESKCFQQKILVFTRKKPHKDERKVFLPEQDQDVDYFQIRTKL